MGMAREGLSFGEDLEEARGWAGQILGKSRWSKKQPGPECPRSMQRSMGWSEDKRGREDLRSEHEEGSERRTLVIMHINQWV